MPQSSPKRLQLIYLVNMDKTFEFTCSLSSLAL